MRGQGRCIDGLVRLTANEQLGIAQALQCDSAGIARASMLVVVHHNSDPRLELKLRHESAHAVGDAKTAANAANLGGTLHRDRFITVFGVD